jgi:hypothetical protein
MFRFFAKPMQARAAGMNGLSALVLSGRTHPTLHSSSTTKAAMPKSAVHPVSVMPLGLPDLSNLTRGTPVTPCTCEVVRRFYNMTMLQAPSC